MRYFPYFRGRQFELVALRELLAHGVMRHDVVPVVEPVKVSSSLIGTLESYVSSGYEIGIVANPGVGDFMQEYNLAGADFKNKMRRLADNGFVIPVLLQNESIGLLPNYVYQRIAREPERWGALYSSPEWIDTSLEQIARLGLRYKFSFVPDATPFRRKIAGRRILIHDAFNKCGRNSDYSLRDDELFSEDILYADGEGYIGFSDFSIVGDAYSDGGFAPYAVVIHFVYPDSHGALRIHHFVSDSNDGFDDPAGKFFEAARKLDEWVVNNYRSYMTIGLQQLLSYYRQEAYPGLGSLKKFAIMHHLELVGRMLSV